MINKLKKLLIKSFTVLLLTLTLVTPGNFEIDPINPDTEEPGISTCVIGDGEDPFDEEKDPYKP